MIILFSTSKELGGHEFASLRIINMLRANMEIFIYVNKKNRGFKKLLTENNLEYTDDLVVFLLAALRLNSKSFINLAGNWFAGIGLSFFLKLLQKRVDIYVPYYVNFSSLEPRVIKAHLKNGLQRLSTKMYTACITIDDTTKLSLDRIGFKGEVFIVTNEVNQLEKSQSKFLKPDFDVLLIGRIYFKQKGQDEAIQFLEDYSETLNTKLKVVIAGSGVDEEKLMRILDNKDLINEYTFLGFCEDVTSLYERARIILMASKFEGVPLVLLEGMTRCKPILARDIEEFRGFLPSENRMHFIKDDHSKLQALLELNGYQEYLKFNYKKSNELNLYEKTLGR